MIYMGDGRKSTHNYSHNTNKLNLCYAKFLTYTGTKILMLKIFFDSYKKVHGVWVIHLKN